MQRRREWEARHGQTDGGMDELISLEVFSTLKSGENCYERKV